MLLYHPKVKITTHQKHGIKIKEYVHRTWIPSLPVKVNRVISPDWKKAVKSSANYGVI